MDNAPRVVVFDFDGVILESVPVKEQAIFDLFLDLDAKLEERRRVLELHRETSGIGRRDRVRLLLTEALRRNATKEVVDSLLHKFAKLIWNGLLACPEVPGIRDFLDSVADMPCYVVSASPHEELRAVARARDFHRYFIDLLGMPPAKTDSLNKIAARENVPSESILFIGDKISDYKAAQNVGTLFLGRISPENPTNFPRDVVVINDFGIAGQRVLGNYLRACSLT